MTFLGSNTKLKVGALAALVVLAVVMFSIVASGVFLRVEQPNGRYSGAEVAVQWWRWMFVVDRSTWGGAAANRVDFNLLKGAAAGLALSGVIVALAVAQSVRWYREGLVVPTTRSENDIHGHSAWATEAQQRRRFHKVNREYGCLVLAEIRRRDLEPVHGIPYDPDDKSTWGEGGKGDLLVDDARLRSTHILGIAGSGIGKTQASLCTLVHPEKAWRGDLVVGDPKGSLHRFTAKVRRALFGHRIVKLGIAEQSINAFDTIDPASPFFETDVQALVDRMFVEKKGVPSGEDGKWVLWGKTLVVSLVAHMCADPDWPAEKRSPTWLRAAIARNEAALRDIIRGVADRSPCRFAREQAASVLVDAKDTWSGVFINAQAGTSWLSNAAYARLVSERSFDVRDLGQGNCTVYVCLSPKTLKGSPAVAKMLYGTMMEHLYDLFEKGKRIVGRVLFEIDEAYQLGALEILERMRDLGREAGITMRLWYQSVGQIAQVWGEHGKQSWYASTAYRMYAGISDMVTAREAAELCGRYTAKVQQKGESVSRTGRAIIGNTPTRGQNSTETETPRDLQMAHEFLQDWADDEVLVFTRGMYPIRAGLPLAYRRQEIQDVILRFAANDNDPDKEEALDELLGRSTPDETREAA